MARLPSFTSMWNKYPNGPAEDVKALIGGNINMAWVTNTCVIRICYAMNRCGHVIHAGAGLHTARGGDGYRYGFRVSEFKVYMEKTYGKPKKFEEVSKQKGIILFNVSVWSDATGHFDLWDGAACKHEGYFEKADSVFIWPCA